MQADTESLSKCPRRTTDRWRTIQPQEEDTEDTVEVEMEEGELVDEDWDKEETIQSRTSSSVMVQSFASEPAALLIPMHSSREE
jgi:hypothetical protein